MARRVYVERNSHSDDWAALVVVVIAVVYGKELLWVGAFVLVVWMILKFTQARENLKTIQLVNSQAIALEAEHQALLYNQGDPYGTYGRYDPYTMPMTRPILDNYDDGLDQWG